MSKPRHVHGHVHHRHPVLKKHPSLRKNYCFGCGKDNPDGMRLKFAYDEEARRFVAHFRLGRRFTGPPLHAQDVWTDAAKADIATAADGQAEWPGEAVRCAMRAWFRAAVPCSYTGSCTDA